MTENEALHLLLDKETYANGRFRTCLFLVLTLGCGSAIKQLKCDPLFFVVSLLTPNENEEQLAALQIAIRGVKDSVHLGIHHLISLESGSRLTLRMVKTHAMAHAIIKITHTNHAGLRSRMSTSRGRRNPMLTWLLDWLSYA